MYCTQSCTSESVSAEGTDLLTLQSRVAFVNSD